MRLAVCLAGIAAVCMLLACGKSDPPKRCVDGRAKYDQAMRENRGTDAVDHTMKLYYDACIDGNEMTRMRENAERAR